MSLALHRYNIVRISDGENITHCTIIQMCYDYALVKYQGKRYRVSYGHMDKVVGHELLMPDETPGNLAE